MATISALRSHVLPLAQALKPAQLSRALSTVPRPGHIGPYSKIHAVGRAFDNTFRVLCPNPQETLTASTGLKTTVFSTSSGEQFVSRSVSAQQEFWDIIQGKETTDHPSVDPSKASDSELKEALQAMKDYERKSSSITTMEFRAQDPDGNVEHYKQKGLHQGPEAATVKPTEESVLRVKFVPKEEAEAQQKNPDAIVGKFDHSVINMFNSQRELFDKVLGTSYWGGKEITEKIRSQNVQFYTEVRSESEELEQLIPLNSLHETEEDLVKALIHNDSLAPPYLTEAALKNQITRNLYDANEASFPPERGSEDPAFQHLALRVEGFFPAQIQRIREAGIATIPAPHESYYQETERDLAQRALTDDLYQLIGIDTFDLPNHFHSEAPSPADANASDLLALLDKADYPNAQAVIQKFEQLRPVFAFVQKNTLSLTEETLPAFKKGLAEELRKADIPVTDHLVAYLTNKVLFNKVLLSMAQKSGILADLQISNSRELSGYLLQTFSQLFKGDGRQTSFLEFLQRICLTDVDISAEQGLHDLGERTESQKVQDHARSCGFFGNGNFPGLMKGLQRLMEEQNNTGVAQATEELFKVPLASYEQQQKDPFYAMQRTLDGLEEGPQKQKAQAKLDNCRSIYTSCLERGLVQKPIQAPSAA